MKFKAGDTVTTSDGRLVEIIQYATNGFFQVKSEFGGITTIHRDSLTPLVQEIEEPKKLKMEFALEKNFKEILKHIESDSYQLTSQEMAHDYDERDKEHMITINITLKENE